MLPRSGRADGGDELAAAGNNFLGWDSINTQITRGESDDWNSISSGLIDKSSVKWRRVG
jgi:hypothetical protein